MEKLRAALSGKVSSGTVTDNISYYEDYINTEIRKGRSEEEVLGELGDPRLIARTIVETHSEETSGPAYGNARGGSSGRHYEQTARQREDGGHYESERRFFRIPGWVLLILGILLLTLAFSFLFSLASVLLPPILLILVIVFFVKLFRDWIN